MAYQRIKKYLADFLRDTRFRLCDAFVILLTAFISGNTYTAVFFPFDDLTGLEFFSHAKFWVTFATVAVFITFVFALLRDKRVINWCFLIFSVCFAAALTVALPSQIYFNLGLAFILFFIIRYATRDNGLGIEHFEISRRTSFIVTVAAYVIFTATVSYFTVVKYMTFAQSTFDFGIFCQMFEQMAKTGLPYTTVERGEYLSHFAVHFSPVYYLLLPGYMIFRSPVYLLIMQAAIVGAGMFPLRRICLEMGFSNLTATMSCLVFALFPTMANGCFYDFHENKFLSVFILWMIYFALRKNNIGTLIFALATLSVKEDAAIYVIAVALWMLLTKRNRIFSIVLMCIAAIYFVFACNMIQLSGGEIMMSRLDRYYLNEDGGFIDVIKTCFYDIGYLIDQVFNGADTTSSQVAYSGQKVEFLIWTFIPLAFMPLASRHTTHLVLLIPMLVINLMPDWIYQYNIDFQYTYGSCALLLASAFLAISERTPSERLRILIGAISVCLVFSVSTVFPKADRYITRYSEAKGVYKYTAEALETIPRDASVTAYGFFTPHLYYIDDLQTVPRYYGEYEQTEYVAIDSRYLADINTQYVLEMMGEDYTLILEKGYAQIYKLND